jgi:FlaA1/EpsC-like NDP-sugar epimerase
VTRDADFEELSLVWGQPPKVIWLKTRNQSRAATGDIAIHISGLRPGEKLYEELLIGDNPEPTAHPRIMKAHEPCLPWSELTPELQALGAAAQADDVAAIKALLTRLVQGYQPG